MEAAGGQLEQLDQLEFELLQLEGGEGGPLSRGAEALSPSSSQHIHLGSSSADLMVKKSLEERAVESRKMAREAFEPRASLAKGRGGGGVSRRKASSLRVQSLLVGGGWVRTARGVK